MATAAPSKPSCGGISAFNIYLWFTLKSTMRRNYPPYLPQYSTQVDPFFKFTILTTGNLNSLFERRDRQPQRCHHYPAWLPQRRRRRSWRRSYASPSSMRTSKSLGSFHSFAFSRRCRAMSAAQMTILARARASDVAYPKTCFTCTSI